MKNSCNNCKALTQVSMSGFGNGEHKCLLGHPIKCTKTISFIEVGWKPLEDCEKPLIHKEARRLCVEKGISYITY